MTPDNLQHLDDATSDRLSKLHAMPLDMAALTRSIEGQIPRQRRTLLQMPWVRTVGAVAAGALILAILGLSLMNTAPAPAMASAEEMARLHRELVSGKVAARQVDTIEAANRTIVEQWPQSPDLPQVPQEHVMACCLNVVDNQRVAFVMLRHNGVPVTMAVAKAEEVQMPAGEMTHLNGQHFHIQSHEQINMLMVERDGRWVCLTAELPTNQLMDLAAKLKF